MIQATADDRGPGLEGLLRDLAPRALGVIARRYGDFADAEDAVQEALIAASVTWPAEGRPDNPLGWLIRVAHNVAMDTLRMRRSRPAEVAEEAAPEAPVADHADAVVTAVHVRRALERLSPSHRAVIEEIYLNGCTAREAAARLGIPEGTAFSRSYYALRILRQELGVILPEVQRTAA